MPDPFGAGRRAALPHAATWPAGRRTAAWSSSAASTTRSRSAATGSSSARSRRRWPRTRRPRTRVVVARGQPGRQAARRLPRGRPTARRRCAAELRTRARPDPARLHGPGGVRAARRRIPLTVNGKLDRRALPAPGPAAAARRPRVRRARAPTGSSRSPRSGPRRARPRRGSACDDSFFDLGGDSIRAVALVGALRAAGFDVEPSATSSSTVPSPRWPSCSPARPAAEPDAAVAPFDADRRGRPGRAARRRGGRLPVLPGPARHARGDARRRPANPTTTSPLPGPSTTGRSPLDALRARRGTLVAPPRGAAYLVRPDRYSVPLQLVHATAELAVTSRPHALPRARPSGPGAARAHRRRAGPSVRPRRPPLLRLQPPAPTSSWWLTITECHPILEGWSYHSLLMELVRATADPGRRAAVAAAHPVGALRRRRRCRTAVGRR